MRVFCRGLAFSALALMAFTSPLTRGAPPPSPTDPYTRIRDFSRARMWNGEVPSEAHLKASIQRARMLRAAKAVSRAHSTSATLSSWVSLGPQPAHFTGALTGDFSGKVDDIA